MFRTTGDIKDEVLVRLNVSTTAAGFYTDTILNDWLDQAHRIAAGFKKWSFVEGRSETTFASSTERYTYPENWKPDSIRILQLGGKRLRKLNYEDYENFKEDTPSSEARVFSDFGLEYYINPSVDSSGTIAVWGQYTPAAFDRTDIAVLTVFSDRDEDGNEAMIELMLSYAKMREKKFQESEAHRKRAIEKLDNIWERIKNEQFGYHTKDREMYKRVDIVSGALREDILKRDQWF